VADGDRMPPEMKLLTSIMANLDSKLDHLLLFSDKERQLEELRKENSELKLENKRLTAKLTDK
jgi:regulator of replication initiation timing